ncbi:helix-turn-helix domain-containing protein [Actinomycetospora chiangmaiensis]|uniref:helix-turn-helix domain-containing protein n=1 Tax=Actinomycetospora chiangmaiensis TaxID=402650 RepID=UPI00039B3035|nr:helix-turn-helix transcriptional regulator [Actinomycetospora chiangmaiensis]
MPRPQRELDPAGGPLVEFARDLRLLREQAGGPKFTTMARRTGRSKTALADASAGRHLPRWETVEDYVRACDAEPEPWRTRWEALRADLGTPPTPVDDADDATDDAADEPAGANGAVPTSSVSDAPLPPTAGGTTTGEPPTGEPGADTTTTTTTTTTDEPPAGTRRRPAVGRRALLVAAGIAVLGIVLGFVLGRVTVPDPPVVPQTVEAIEVQNKVALGADRLVEDRTPAYLSTEALSYCASPSRSCKVPGTEMVSGAAIVASCWTTGQMMWNVDLADPDQARNPDRAQSDLWYRASFPDGRTGYLSEVYVVRGDRGGRGLPRCNP